jgi:hypothetical protein
LELGRELDLERVQVVDLNRRGVVLSVGSPTIVIGVGTGMEIGAGKGIDTGTGNMLNVTVTTVFLAYIAIWL